MGGEDGVQVRAALRRHLDVDRAIHAPRLRPELGLKRPYIDTAVNTVLVLMFISENIITEDMHKGMICTNECVESEAACPRDCVAVPTYIECRVPGETSQKIKVFFMLWNNSVNLVTTNTQETFDAINILRKIHPIVLKSQLRCAA